ncbi:MAG: hypothetical protein QOD00_4227 [Blastocatellia bacterium]|jgi:hypothetical protein|nr:hypothetical protein [Blastocatellia bacterium]
MPPLASLFMLMQSDATRYTQPTYFLPVVVFLLVAGLIGWIIATVLGFARARAFGPATRWFALASACMIVFHLQFILLALGLILDNPEMTLAVGAFFNLFALLAAVCAIIGFLRLTSSPR